MAGSPPHAPWRALGAPVLLLLIAQSVVRGQDVVKRDMKVRATFSAPDGFRRPVLTVDGQFPGPTILAKKGDRVELSVSNELSGEDGIAMHVHGIHQRGTPWMDGTLDSACPVMRGDPAFLYNFTVEHRVGTHWYHAHAGPFQRSDGLFGAFIIEDPDAPFKYDEDRVLLLSDWYHKSGREMAEGLMRKDFVWVGDPQALLINGKAANESCAFRNTTTTSAAPAKDEAGGQDESDPCRFIERIEVQAGQATLLRVIGATSLVMVDLAIDGHDFEVVEADGGYVEPFTTSHLLVNSGERIGAILKPRPDTVETGDYWIQVQSRFRKLVKGYGVLSYKPPAGDGSSDNSTTVSLPAATPGPHPGVWDADLMSKEDRARAMKKNSSLKMDDWKPLMDEVYREEGARGVQWSTQLKAHSTLRAIGGPPAPNKFFQLEGTQCRTDESFNETLYAPYERPLVANQTMGFLRWCVNSVSARTSGSRNPLLMDVYNHQLDEKLLNSHGPLSSVQEVKKGDVVEVVLTNGYALDGVMEQHPWHLHGHSFWVMGFGQGDWDAEGSWRHLDFEHPPLKDTVTVFPFQWTVIRFVADNPGVWPLHCHIESHQIMGMQVFFIERRDEIPPPPSSLLHKTSCPATTNTTTTSKDHHGSRQRRNLRIGLVLGPRSTPTDRVERAVSFFLDAVGLLAAVALIAGFVACVCYGDRILTCCGRIPTASDESRAAGKKGAREEEQKRVGSKKKEDEEEEERGRREEKLEGS